MAKLSSVFSNVMCIHRCAHLIFLLACTFWLPVVRGDTESRYSSLQIPTVFSPTGRLYQVEYASIGERRRGDSPSSSLSIGLCDGGGQWVVVLTIRGRSPYVSGGGIPAEAATAEHHPLLLPGGAFPAHLRILSPHLGYAVGGNLLDASALSRCVLRRCLDISRRAGPSFVGLTGVAARAVGKWLHRPTLDCSGAGEDEDQDEDLPQRLMSSSVLIFGTGRDRGGVLELLQVDPSGRVFGRSVGAVGRSADLAEGEFMKIVRAWKRSHKDGNQGGSAETREEEETGDLENYDDDEDWEESIVHDDVISFLGSLGKGADTELKPTEEALNVACRVAAAASRGSGVVEGRADELPYDRMDAVVLEVVRIEAGGKQKNIKNKEEVRATVFSGKTLKGIFTKGLEV